MENEFQSFIEQKKGKMSYRKLAKAVSVIIGEDIAHTTLTRMISPTDPTKKPRIDIILALAQIFDVDPSELLKRKFPEQYASELPDRTAFARKEVDKLSEAEQRGVISEIKKRK